MHCEVMIGASRQSRHDIQTQSLKQLLHHLAGVSVSLVVRQLHRVRAVVGGRWDHISHLTMNIAGRFQCSIAEGVHVVHAEQGHLPVGR